MRRLGPRGGAQIAVTAVALALPACGGEAAPDHPLLETARDEGTVPVIVQLESLEAQQPVIDLLAGTGSRVTTRYERLPLLAAVVDEDGLRKLLDSPLVLSVEENTRDAPTEGEGT